MIAFLWFMLVIHIVTLFGGLIDERGGRSRLSVAYDLAIIAWTSYLLVAA